MQRIVLLVILLLATGTRCCNVNKTTSDYDMLFVVHDAGESLGLKPVIARLSSYRTVGVLALGQPAGNIFAMTTNITVLTPADVGIISIVIDGDAGREQNLTPDDVRSMMQCVQLSPGAVVIVGMAYSMQAQLAAVYHSAAYVVGYNDGFQLWSNTSAESRWFFSTTTLHEVFVTAQAIAHSMPSTIIKLVTGSPTLDDWAGTAHDTNRIIQTRITVYGDHVDVPCVMFAGGYGAGYNDSLSLFCAAARLLNTKMKFSFSPHPGYDPNVEKQYFYDHDCANIIIIYPYMNITTAEACVASNASLSQDSTVGGQSVSVGVPHAYVHSSNIIYDDVFTTAGLIPTCDDDADLYRTLVKDFAAIHYHVDPARLIEAGVPHNGTAHMTDRLLLLNT